MLEWKPLAALPLSAEGLRAPTQGDNAATRAQDKRDKLIAAAKREYEQTLIAIAALEQDLLGKVSSRHKKISACIESVIPKDRTFTTTDILAALEALDPGRA